MPEKLYLPNGKSPEGLPVSNTSSCLSDRSFFLLKDYEILGLPFTPVDEQTGVSLILHPDGSSRDRHIFPKDRHHPLHPKPEIKDGTLSGDALRAVRIQVTSYDQHHLDYHQNFYGPELPTNEIGRFKLLVFYAANCIPDQAIAFNRRGQPYFKKLTSEDRLKLWEDNTIRMESPDLIRSFLKEYTFRQDFSDIKQSVIDEFLNTKDFVKKRELGNTLLANGVYKATLPLRGIFEQAYKAELIPPTRSKRVTKFVMDALNVDRYRDRLIGELGKRVLQAAA